MSSLPPDPALPDPDDEGSRPGPDELAKMLADLVGDPSIVDNPQIRAALSAMGGMDLDPAQLAIVRQQMEAMFSGPTPDGPLDPAQATDMARRVTAASGDTSVSQADRKALGEAVHVAQLWLDQATDFEAAAAAPQVWSRAEWVEATMPAWIQLVGPVADGVTGAMTSAMRGQLDDLAEHGGLEQLGSVPGMPAIPPGTDPSMLMSQMGPMVQRMSAMMFAAQTGQAVGTLAGEVLSGTEVGLPLLSDHAVALLPQSIAEFSEGLAVDPAQVRLYLAARESARSRLFTAAPWLAAALTSAVQAYARDISFDVDAIAAKVQGLDPSDPAALQQALGTDLFATEPSDAQRRALDRLETALALVEGWVDVVADRATRPHLPQAEALGEAVRRRRATGGPAEKIFAQLVGLQLRPRRLRDAANLFAALESEGGAELRDSAWAHPDVAPTSADLDDPLGFVERVKQGASDDFDAALAAWLEGTETGASDETPDDDPSNGPADGPADGSSDGPRNP